MALEEPLRLTEAVGDKEEEVAAFEEQEGPQGGTLVVVEGPLSIDRARGEARAPTGKAATAAGTTSFLEGRGEMTDC